MHEGSCLCGAVRYLISGILGPIIYCHCRQCRKAQGTAFATNAPVDADRFQLVAGEDALTGYQSSPGKLRCFCRFCGSPIFSRRDSLPDVVRVRIGTLDTPTDQRPTAHNYVATKAEWFEIIDDLPQYKEKP